MKQKDILGIAPSQYTGKEIEAEATVEFLNENDAILFYEIVKGRLLHVNNWHQLAGLVSAKFQLIDADGEETERKVQKGDFFKIDIPGPGSSEGDGYDWVIIEELKELSIDGIQSIGFRVRPTNNPFGNKNETAHFYSDESTSSFMVTRERNKISAIIIDRNIKPNINAGSLTDKIRDTAVGMGAMGFFSKIQWQSLAEGLVKS